MAKIFNRVATTDQILILGIRESVTQPFNAPNWTDLRVGMFLSLTAAAADDTPTGLAETFATASVFQQQDYLWYGLKNSSSASVIDFIGWASNFGGTLPVNSILASSDLAIGTTNAFYWRPLNSGGTGVFSVFTSGSYVGVGQNTIQNHFFQANDPGNPAPAGYYSVLHCFRITRPTASSNSITVQIPHPGTNSADIFWTPAPTQANLIAQLDPFPSPVVTLGPFTFMNIPDALYAYWPFRNSRLRISAWGILRAA